jgi:hypothetical protein
MDEKQYETLTQLLDREIAHFKSVKERTRKPEHWDEKIKELQETKSSLEILVHGWR